MKSFRKELWFDIPGRRAFINITPEVEAAYVTLGQLAKAMIAQDPLGLSAA